MDNPTSRNLARRDFLAVSAAAAASAVVPGISQAAPADAEYRNRQPNMTYRRLGRTGMMVSSIGMGGDDIAPDNIDLVLWAVDQGLNYFDTAPHYNRGLSEKGYAAVLKARGRDKLFQATKVNAAGARSMSIQRMFNSLSESEQTEMRNKVTEEVKRRDLENPNYMGNYFTGQAQGLRQAILANLLAEKFSDKIDRASFKKNVIDSVEGSLKNLGTDYLDCVLMRDMQTPYEIKNCPEILEAFEQLKKEGKARFLGFSAHNDPAGTLEAALETGVYSMCLIGYHFLNHPWVGPVIEKAKKADYGVLAMKASRIVQNPFNRRETIPERVKALDALIPGDKLTIFQKGFTWALQNPNLSGVVAGMTTMEHAKADVPLAFAKA
jgi:aryl-alcohol dehydrogenase-like predicted oxidoreductase